jgi:hypothetical protein
MYQIINGDVFRSLEQGNGCIISENIGAETKTEVKRIDLNTVTDITSTFDVTAGKYVETSRVNRTDPSITKEQKIAELDAACNKTILGVFTSSAMGAPHQYVFDYDAQLNMTGAYADANVDPNFAADWSTRMPV